MQLVGKRCVITGGGSGIGRATALLFSNEGGAVVVADIDRQKGEETVGTIRQNAGNAWFVKTDVSSAVEMESLIGKANDFMGGIDVFLNNAGVYRAGWVTDTEEQDWDKVMAVNPKSCFLSAKYVVPIMRIQGGGSIINMSSIAGLKSAAGTSAYSASKGAIISFTRALAAEVGQYKIRANCICPGWIDTPFNLPVIEMMGGRKSLEEMVERSVPLRRQGAPDEIAPAALYLASDASSYVTGQLLVVDGGLV